MEKIRQAHPQAKLEGLAADLAKPEGAAATSRRFPAVDILVNNLGMYEHRPFEADQRRRLAGASSRSTS